MSRKLAHLMHDQTELIELFINGRIDAEELQASLNLVYFHAGRNNEDLKQAIVEYAAT